MNNNKQYSVILLHSTSHAIQLEKSLSNTGIACKLIPVPRHLSSDCGVCIRISRSDKNKFSEIIAEKITGLDGIYDI
jgi:hypothetical protein